MNIGEELINKGVGMYRSEMAKMVMAALEPVYFFADFTCFTVFFVSSNGFNLIPYAFTP